MKLNLFPKHNIESTWWIRLVKVLIIVITFVFAFTYYLNSVEPDMQRQPYFAYSFEPNFNSYTNPTINCDGVPGKCSGGQNGNSDGIVLAYQTSSPERNNEVNAINQNITSDQVISILESRGEITNNLEAKDINDVNEFLQRDWLMLLVYTILLFLFLSQVILRIIFYIIYGKKSVKQ